MKSIRIYRFLWKVVGEDHQLLIACDKRTRNIFAISGLLFLIFLVIGVLAYRFVFNGIFKIPTISWVLALIWTAIIFNIYKLNLSTFSADRPNYNGGYIMSLFVRLIFMALIGVTLIKPLEAWVFNDFMNAGLARVSSEKMARSMDVSDRYFSAEIGIVEQELSSLEEQVAAGRISIQEEAFATLEAKKKQLAMEQSVMRKETDLLFQPSELFFLGLLELNGNHPWLWLLSLFLLTLFLLPLLLKFSISPQSTYTRDKLSVQKRMILEEYNRFRKLYPELFHRVGHTEIIWEENYTDAPFNKKRQRKDYHLGEENEYLKQIHGL
ncbi:MAG: DUF4407 domain-containing protein [Flagellimonas sp.]